MDLVQTLINAGVVAAVGLTLCLMVHGLRTEVRADIADLRAEVRADIAEVRAEVRAGFEGVRRELGDLRSDLTQVALVVGARPPSGRRRRAADGRD